MTFTRIDSHDALIDFYKQNELEMSDSIVRDDRPVFSLTAMDGGTLAGAATLSKRRGQFVLDYVAVLPAYRRQKLGATLVNALLNEAKALNAKRVHIVTRNKPFFQSLGFVQGESGALRLTKDCRDCEQYRTACFPVEMIYNFSE